MDSELLQIACELAKLQARLLTLIEMQGTPPPCSEPPADAVHGECAPSEIPKEARCTFLKHGKGAPPAVLKGVQAAGFMLADVSGGVAFHKDFYSRGEAWVAARRVWQWLRDAGHVPRAAYNTLRKCHTTDWYIYAHDPNMEKKTWVRDRIQERR